MSRPQLWATPRYRPGIISSHVLLYATALTLQAGEGKGAGAGVDVLAEEEVEGAEQRAVLGQAGQGRAGEGGHRHGELGQVAASCTVILLEPTRAKVHEVFTIMRSKTKNRKLM